jgi:hypothetical protein
MDLAETESINDNFLFFQLLDHDLDEFVDDLHGRFDIERVCGARPDQLSVRLGRRIKIGLDLSDSFFDQVAGRIDQGIDGEEGPRNRIEVVRTGISSQAYSQAG